MAGRGRFMVVVNRFVRRWIFARSALMRAAFGIRVVGPPTVQSYCEWGTLLIRFVVRRYVTPGARLLDVGTGAHGTLAIYCRKRLTTGVVAASDILYDRVLLARRTASLNGASVRFVVADLCAGIGGAFDVILFNPPAIPTDEMAELGVAAVSVPGLGSRRCWSSDGGSDGLDAVRRFLAGVGRLLAPGGRVLIALNPMRCPAPRLRRLAAAAGLDVRRIHRLPGVNAVYVLSAGS